MEESFWSTKSEKLELDGSLAWRRLKRHGQSKKKASRGEELARSYLKIEMLWVIQKPCLAYTCIESRS